MFCHCWFSSLASGHSLACSLAKGKKARRPITLLSVRTVYKILTLKKKHSPKMEDMGEMRIISWQHVAVKAILHTSVHFG